MKDAIEFVNSIGYSDFENAMTQFFDEYMALYNTVGTYTAIQRITSEVKDGITINFKLDFSTPEEAEKMHFILLGIPLSVYGRRFTIAPAMTPGSLSVYVEFKSIE